MNATTYLPPPTLGSLPVYRRHLIEEERSEATIEKYTRDIRAFYQFLGTRSLTKEIVLEYKDHLLKHYKDASTNSMISALNGYFSFFSREDLRVKQVRVQRAYYLSADRELTEKEYRRLVKAARQCNKQTLSLVMQTLCATGIRVSELEDITVASVYAGEATVASKGKRRQIFISQGLQKLLITYIRDHDIKSGPIFLNKQGSPLSRYAVWKQMKNLCESAGVAASKVFPHNLRHLFARLFYAIERDVVKLADVMGHESINTTRIYTAETGAAHRKMMNKIPLIC